MNQISGRILDEITFTGHPNVLSTHHRTLEVTTESHLTLRGNCIIGMNASKACFTLSPVCKKELREEQKIQVTIETENYSDTFFGYGCPDLPLSSPISLVFRRSDFVSDRTALIKCSKGSDEINRELVRDLQNPTTIGKLVLILPEG